MTMIRVAACGLASLMLMSAAPVSAQTVEQRSGAAAAQTRAERERIRRANRDLILRRDATREERRLYDIQRLRNRDGGPRAYEQRAPESAPANRQNGTVRTQ